MRSLQRTSKFRLKLLNSESNSTVSRQESAIALLNSESFTIKFCQDVRAVYANHLLFSLHFLFFSSSVIGIKLRKSIVWEIVLAKS